jgi:hypothetical protein
MLTLSKSAVYHNMNRPTFVDKINLKLNPRYLYPGQLTQPLSNLNVALVHKVSSAAYWKIMDYITIQKGSILKYLGSGKQLKLSGDLLPSHFLFEVIDATSDRHTGVGDIVALTPDDRKALTPAVPPSLPQDHTPTYFTAENQ